LYDRPGFHKSVRHVQHERPQILDRDLAELYGVETRVLNQAVGRNIERFPKDFMFTLDREEIMRISQIVTSSEIKFSKSARCFTEQGVAMFNPLNAQFV